MFGHQHNSSCESLHEWKYSLTKRKDIWLDDNWRGWYRETQIESLRGAVPVCCLQRARVPAAQGPSDNARMTHCTSWWLFHPPRCHLQWKHAFAQNSDWFTTSWIDRQARCQGQVPGARLNGWSVVTSPPRGLYILCTSCIIVDFPLPLSPTRATVCPASTLKTQFCEKCAFTIKICIHWVECTKRCIVENFTNKYMRIVDHKTFCTQQDSHAGAGQETWMKLAHARAWDVTHVRLKSLSTVTSGRVGYEKLMFLYNV